MMLAQQYADEIIRLSRRERQGISKKENQRQNQLNSSK
jgi:hypothetical protein